MSQKQIPAAEPMMESGGIGLELFFEQHSKSLIIAAVVAVLVGAAAVAWMAMLHNTRLAAEAFFANAKDVAGWQQVVAKYPGSMPAADALLLIAQAQRDEEKLDESTASYQKFLAEYPEHPLAGGALVGVAENLDVAGKLNEAAATYESVNVRFPKSYAAPYALFAQADILIREDKYAEARKILKTIVSEFSDVPVAQIAGAQLDRLGDPGANIPKQ